MIILHATCLDGRFLLWGETPGEPSGSGTAARRGRKPKIPRPEAFPFDAGFATLASALRDAGIAAKLGKRSQQSVAAWVPTRGAKPIPSSPLIGGAPSSRAKASLAPWSVSALVLPPSVAVELLCRCGDQQTLARGVVAGQDLAFWAQGLRFAGSLVARQQYLPGLETEDGAYRACWQPVFAGPDAERLASCARWWTVSFAPRVRRLLLGDAGAGRRRRPSTACTITGCTRSGPPTGS